MELILKNLGKKFEGKWIFRNVNLHLKAGSRTLITGRNGSGKSTLAKSISGLILPSEGTVEYRINSKVISDQEAYKNIQLCGPYIDLVEDFTLEEFLHFHSQFKTFSIPLKEVIQLGYFEEHRNKYIRNFSSGMKQRAKLLLSLLTDASLTIIDEPTANLDDKTIRWYHDLVGKHAADKTIIICSNSPSVDAQFCTSTMNIEDFVLGER